MVKYWAVHQTLHRRHPPLVEPIQKCCQIFCASSDVIATVFAVSKLKSQPPKKAKTKSLKPKPKTIQKLSNIWRLLSRYSWFPNVARVIWRQDVKDCKATTLYWKYDINWRNVIQCNAYVHFRAKLYLVNSMWYLCQ